MATGYADDDDVPPLEDLSELIGQIKTLGNVESENKESRLGEVTDILNQDSETKEKEQLDSERKVTRANGSVGKACDSRTGNVGTSSASFGGFQKGFLNKKKPTSNHNKDSVKATKATSVSSKHEEIPTISPKEPSSSNLMIPDVQEAMKTSSLPGSKEWVTDDLLKKIESRPDLQKKLADPTYSQALNHFRSNPQEAWRHFQNNKELQTFIKEFCAILGEHFTLMAEQAEQNKPEIDGKPPTSSTTSAADEEKMAKILSDPETLNMLKDPWISKLVTNLKENPPEARKMLARSKPEVLPKIKKLIDAGILTFG